MTILKWVQYTMHSFKDKRFYEFAFCLKKKKKDKSRGMLLRVTILCLQKVQFCLLKSMTMLINASDFISVFYMTEFYLWTVIFVRSQHISTFNVYLNLNYKIFI